MIERSETHRTDTKAVRLIFTQLSEDWLLRNLDERDYGIDLQLERFNTNEPTGDFIFAQVKGTEKPFTEKVKLSFPTKTIKYSQMFNVPFILFHTSVADKKTYFVWLQKYAEIKLQTRVPNWKTQDDVTIEFPSENVLENNIDKIIEFIKKDKRRRAGVKFLMLYENLLLHAESILLELNNDVSETCCALCKELLLMEDFIKETCLPFRTEQWTSLKELPKTFAGIKINQKSSLSERKTIRKNLKSLDEVKIAFLSSDDRDEFLFDIGDSPF